jgi:two-component system, sensor histidine kinase PdtaS
LSEVNGARAPTGSRTLRAATALIVLMFVLFVVVLTVSLLREREAALHAAEARAAAASQVVATNVGWITELSRQALGRIDDALGIDIAGGSASVEDRIRSAVDRLPGNVKAYVVGADGATLFSTDPAVQPLDIRDREYFAAPAAGTRFHVSSLMVSRLDGKQIFAFSRRLERGGIFQGVAILSFDVDLFRDIWQSLSLDSRSTVSLLRDDGQLVARYPLAEGPLDLSNYVLFTEYLKLGDAGTYPAISPADGVARIVGYRRVRGAPLVALASVSTDTSFAQFRRNTAITLLFAVPTALALAFATVFIFRLLRRDRDRQRRLLETLELNRMLVRDTHHRVKNNLQAIMSLVRLHGLPQQMKADLQGRISAMTAVHEHLYRLDQFAEVNADTLIPAIVDPLREAFAQPVTIDYDIDPVVLHHDQATPLALIVNEVVTNALKYAFPDGRSGTIRVAFKSRDRDHAELSVGDDGVGFDPSLATSGLGGRLVRAMLIQLGGSEPEYYFKGGTRFQTLVTLTDQAGQQPQAAE